MGFEELFDNENHTEYRKSRPYQSYERNHESRHSHYRQRYNTDWMSILHNIRGNRRLKRLVLFVMISFLAIIIVLLAVLAPMIINLIKGISQNGFQGILNELQSLLDKIMSLLQIK